MIPTIHLNGSSRADLMEQLYDQMKAIRTAIEVMLRTGPNGRDYYPQGPDAIKQAIKEHYDRTEKLHQVLRELETIAEGIL